MTRPRGVFTVPGVLPLVRALYARPGGIVGCCLHTTLDDGNCSREDAWYCFNYALEIGHADCIQLAGILIHMSSTQRRKLAAMIHT